MFPGEVQLVVLPDVQEKVMIPSGANFYKWPTDDDAIFYSLDQIVMKLSPPTIKSARGAYEFQEKW